MDLVTMILACSLYADNSVVNAIVQTGSQNQALAVTTVDGESKTLSSAETAVSYAKDQMANGKDIEIGLMQIPSRWVEQNHLNLNDMFKPCKNIVMATKILLQAHEQCTTVQSEPPVKDNQACTLSVYKSGDPNAALGYANKIMAYASDHPFSELATKAIDEQKAAESKPTPQTKPAHRKLIKKSL